MCNHKLETHLLNVTIFKFDRVLHHSILTGHLIHHTKHYITASGEVLVLLAFLLLKFITRNDNFEI